MEERSCDVDEECSLLDKRFLDKCGEYRDCGRDWRGQNGGKGGRNKQKQLFKCEQAQCKSGREARSVTFCRHFYCYH